jgi:hypothetical protein
MADDHLYNPFDNFWEPTKPTPTNALARALAGIEPPKPNPFSNVGNLLNALQAPPYLPPGVLTKSPPATFLGSGKMASATNPLAQLVPAARLAYFAFSFDDVMRVNNVRKSGTIEARVIGRSRGFLDRSIWEKRNIKNDDNLKRLMNQAMTRSSVVCVLIGTDTWRSRWVRYEIARSVIDERGLLAVHINSLNFVGGTGPDPLGINPLHFMGIHRDQTGQYYLAERKPVVTNEATGDVGFAWHWYGDYQMPIKLPQYMNELPVGAIVPLATVNATYDYIADSGAKYLSHWLDAAAIAVGR